MNLNLQPLPTPEHMRIALKIHTALCEMRHGRAGRDEWADCADAVNMVEALVHLRKLESKVYMPLVNRAIDGLVEAIDSEDRTRMRMNRDGEIALTKIVCTYDECMGKMARETIRAAGNRVILKIAESREPDSDVLVVQG